MGNADHCYGCENRFINEVIVVDHTHQYEDHFFGTLTVWFVDGVVFTSLPKAIFHISMELNCSMSESINYIKSLKKIYN